ncbi:uncharacterized protein LOC119377840 [Rhipicephalus sanguineus]|uniref:uncharacterized protein LOC119377840 n=1 Tax=Rhipicephalus sanguineus TaxID=34632 RepID=UPI001892FECF|nr:uncharacterized protein LOC119377840 [Rhipicephalus sanguineus]
MECEAGRVTDPIPILAGLQQGCLLRGLLFNVVIDPIIRDVQGDDVGHIILAYADDLTVLAPTSTLLQGRIDKIEALATGLRLSLIPAKCSSLHMCGETPVDMRPTEFLVSGVPITALLDFEPQRFLGRPVGFRLVSSTRAVIDTAFEKARAILIDVGAVAPSRRAPDLCLPGAHFPMRCGVLTKTDWRRLDDAIRPLVKPELSEACRVDSSYKLLTTADLELRDQAFTDAYSVASARLGWEATRSELEAYLTGSIEEAFRAPATQLRSLWTKARKASRRLSVTWSPDPADARFTCGDVTLTPTHRCRVIRSEVLAADRDLTLHDQPDQGKVMACVAADRASSHFLRTGVFTHLAD